MTPKLTLVSSCLAGLPCRYDARARPDDAVMQAVADGTALPACAEQLGGLPTPRPPVEIVGGDGHDVLAGTASVVTSDRVDLTSAFVHGAHVVAELVAERGITHAVLQDRSPSCGCGTIYDGSHSGALVNGDGVLAAVLKSRGVTVEALRGQSPQR
ncbi:DUF523 domain-containing protein [Arthrobacter psychrolactophilus]|uniref:DUF523 domain-containing protein n=1 Tax=Arthrobacter psychrolactophilus TaxID=92442 RepID=A0A2V5JID0_9MICC|nr:DUF523 domain-containing protein [Arthrobacter psychrolactophilus]PYI39937.1 DUF523 domain-containing protein [Arthrobacter psychrolactophilus]